MKKIVFVTGTRADFGKLKLLIQAVEKSNCLDAYVFATGMHMLPKCGVTVHEILNCEFSNIYLYNNQAFKLGMDITLANTIYGFSCFVRELEPDLIIIHGDRPEALAGAIVGSFNNFRVGHIEGGEISGTIDELIRHSITKLSHIHFVANEKAKDRLIQMGESRTSIFVTGSPETDMMFSDLPCLAEVKKRYAIDFNNYGILIYHPVVTESERLVNNLEELFSAVVESGLNYIVILPNDDTGADIIRKKFCGLEDNPNFRIFPSIRFEFFMTLLKDCDFIIGNSSTGVREAPVFGIPSINIGSRQKGRSTIDSIFNVVEDKESILKSIRHIIGLKFERNCEFGDGKSVNRFMNVLEESNIWTISLQKVFEERQWIQRQ